MKYYERLRVLRIEKLFTQKQVADILYVCQRNYSGYENGSIRIPVESMISLAKFYNVSLDYITGLSDIRTSFPNG